MHKRALRAGAAAFMGSWVLTASAQSAADANTSTEATGLETVTVTAQRREQNLQNVPIVVTNFTPAQLQTQQITSTLDLERYVPNMFASNNVGQASANVYYIRALGQTQSVPTFEPQVSTYIDDIYLARQNANNIALFGVQQVQVLNGPQGTLFGRNSTGGAILVTLQKPGREFGGDAEFSYGQIGNSWADVYRLRGAVDLPLNDQILTRTSFYGITDNGYVYDVTTHQRLNSTNIFGVREALAVLPSALSNVRWDLAFDYERNNSANLLNQPGPDGNRISYSGFSVIGGALKPYLTGLKSTFGQGWVVTSYGVSSNIAWTIGSGTLNFITGYRGLRQDGAADFAVAAFGPLPVADALPTGEFALAGGLKNHQVSQEVKWTEQVNDRFNYTAGAFFLYEQNGNDYGEVLGLGPAFALTLHDQSLRADTTSVAAYAQGDYKVTPALTVTLGGRFTNETKDVIAHPNAPGRGYDTAQIQAVGYPTHLETNQFTPRLALQYQFDPTLMVFASATRGFQGGGWNGLTGNDPVDFNNFGPETIWSYEVGVRSTPSNRLRVNATLFYEDVKGYQLLTDNPHTGSFDTSNGANLYAYGAEAQLEWHPIDPLTLSGTLSSIKAGYYDPSPLIRAQMASCLAGDASACGAGIVRADGTLATPIYTPPIDLTVSARYVLQFPSFSVTPYLGVHYVAKEWFDTANTPGAEASWPGVGGETRKRTLIDASITVASSRLPLTFTAECRNCTRRDYGVADLLGLDYFNTPGMWDVRVNYKF
jgi:iron complex outermembrane receptor protein